MSFQITSEPLDFPLPKIRKIKQRFSAPAEIPVADAVAREFQKIDSSIQRGMRVAVGVGSRGIAQVALITKSVLNELKARGAVPFIVPAMGSHGGATPEGQLEVLAGYGITPETMNVEFRTEMETEHLGTTTGGFPVYFARSALDADAVFPINRVKLHTDFHGPIESGLGKMIVIGFGKHRGASLIHHNGFDTFHDTIPAAARLILEKVRILAGLATVENAREDIARIEIVPGRDIQVREPELMSYSRSLFPRIPFQHLDVLTVDYLGKDISGGGMDPNVTGRYTVRHITEPDRNPKKIVVLRLTELTHGNACGLGLADVTTRAVVDNIDYQQTWTNIVTSTELTGGKTPIWLPNDRQAIALALRTCNRVNLQAPRFVRIHSTLHIEEMWVSEALWQSDGKNNAQLEALTEAVDFAFTPEGNLKGLELQATSYGRPAWSS
jgi:hypothetical protein